MITVQEYIQLKAKLSNLKGSVKSIKSKARLLSTNNIISEIQRQIDDAETQEDVVKYLTLADKKRKLQRYISNQKFNKKDTTRLESQLQEVNTEMDELKNTKSSKSIETQVHISTPTLTPISRPVVTPVTNIAPSAIEKLDNIIAKMEKLLPTPTDGTYYIINLAWTSISDAIKSPVMEFLNMSSYISIEESPNMVVWKFHYDTIEEKTMVKSLQTCASHLLNIMKKTYSTDQSDAEIFGKIQQY